MTHVVSDNLAAGKVEKEMRGIKRAAEIVSPLWIAECLRRGRKLPAGEFRIVRGPPDVVDVAKFFGVGKKGVSEGIVKKKRKGV